MRLLELHLQAFGPFTDCRLDLSAGREGLHLIHGPNEAGKSSALRALHGLLFGIPERTRDDFIHGARDLRIGAHLQAGDGREWQGYRRKGRKNTLLAPDDSSINEDQLQSLLGGVDAETFRRLFGIDHQTLVSGGEELLAERGAAADALFGAGMGRLNLRGLAQALDNEAAEIFRPQAVKPQLNQELARYRELERELKTAGLAARDWTEAEQRLSAAEHEQMQLAEEILHAETRRSQLERVRRTQPRLARLEELDQQLADLGAVPRLPEDFSQRRQQAERQLRENAVQRATLDNRLGRLRQQVAELTIDERLLAEAEAVEAITEALGSHRKAARDRPALVAQRDAARDQAARILALARPDLPLEQANSLRPLLARQRATQQLAAEGARLQAAADHIEKAQRDLAQQLAQREARLIACPAPPPSEALEDAVAAARRTGDLDRQIAELSAELANTQRQAERSLAAAGFWTHDLPALCRAALPRESHIQTFIEREQHLAREAERIANALAEARAEQVRTQERLRALQLGGDIPTEAQLSAARTQREAWWQRIKIRCFGGPTAAQAAIDQPPLTDTDDIQGPLAERFETSQNTADDIADRLRREAGKVHDQANFQARLEQSQALILECERQAKDREAQASALDQDWQALWAALDVKPADPATMRDWRAQVRPLIEQADQRERLAQRLNALEHECSRLISRLNQHLAHPDPAPTLAPETPRQSASTQQPQLSPLLAQAERVLAQRQQQARDHVSLSDACQELRARQQALHAERTAAQQQLTDWQGRWQSLLSELKLPDARDAEAVAVDFERLAALFTLLDKQADLNARIQAIDADARVFAQDARALLARLTPARPEASAHAAARPVLEAETPTDLEPALAELRQRLSHQREDRSRRDELNSQRQQAEQELAQIEDAQTGARAMLAELCRIAGCCVAEQLADIEARAHQRQSCQAEVSAVQAELREAGDGRSLAELRTEAQALARDGLSGELTMLEQQLSLDLRPREHAAIERKLSAQQTLAAMDGNAQAADLAAQLTQCGARIKRLARQWLQHRFAVHLLQDARDRFAERHRDPLLPLIAGYFSRLTHGAFSTVAIDFDQGGPPMLVVRRASGERLGVEDLSTGTRDQLYLALRLATLEQRARHAEPLPLIVDDILVQFDDRRSQATLGALAEFSAHTQVILFTHHRSVIEQAKALAQGLAQGRATADAADKIFIHELCAPRSKTEN